MPLGLLDKNLSLYVPECVRQAKDLIMKQLACRASKIEELKQGQEDEQSYLLNKNLQVEDLHEFLQVNYRRFIFILLFLSESYFKYIMNRSSLKPWRN